MELAQLRAELAASRRREQDLTDFIENASLGLHAVGPDGTILWANQAELDMLGYAREEYVGKHIAAFHADQHAIDDILLRLGNHETLRNREARLRRKDGSIVHVQINSNVRWDEGGFVHTRCFTRDVTDRTLYEQRLITQYAVGRMLSTASSLESIATALIGTIAEHLGWSAAFFWHPENGAMRSIASWPEGSDDSPFALATRRLSLAPGVGLPGRVLEKQAAEWIPDLQSDHNFPRLQLAMEQGFRSAFAFPITVGDSVAGVFEFFCPELKKADEDLLRMADSVGFQIGEFLERTRAEQRLTAREESYRVLTETASDAIVTIDAQGVIQFLNSAAATLFGYAREELVGAGIDLLMPAGFRSMHHAAISRYLETGKRKLPSWQAIPLPGLHRDNHEIPLEISFGEYREGENHLFVAVMRDVTERRRMEASMRQTARLESLGVLAGGIAHDFNNLLTGILGNVRFAMDDLAPNHPATETLQNAVEASERAASLTQQMLAYAGKGRFHIEPIDVSALVRQISALVKLSIPKHVTLQMELEEPLPAVDGDAVQLQQLVMNLVINGAEAIPEHRVGRVLVSTGFRHIDAAETAQFGVGDIQAGPCVVVRVSDNGTGIEESAMARIFDPFFTTKFTGRGLGLAAALGIVRGHKGALRVFSKPGEGSTFSVFLPPSASEAAPAVPLQLTPLRETASGTVLLVDDEPIVLKMAGPGLRRSGYTVVTAENGRIAVERFSEMHDQLTAVILDMTMPVMNGEQALGRMRSIDPAVPVILSSGYDETEATERFAGKGLAGFLQKPYTVTQLVAKVRELSRKIPA